MHLLNKSIVTLSLTMLAACGRTGSSAHVSVVPGSALAPDMTAVLQQLQTPATVVISAKNAVLVTGTTNGGTNYYYDDQSIGILSAAQQSHISVCDVTFAVISLPSLDGATPGLSPEQALDYCAGHPTMLAELLELRTDQTVVIVAANAAVTTGTTNSGANYFYDDDLAPLRDAAAAIGVRICSVAPQALSLPTPSGNSPGLSIDAALQQCR